MRRLYGLISAVIIAGAASIAAAPGFPFPFFSTQAQATLTRSSGESAPSPLDVTNVQKLSLDLATEVGTQVAVSDGFYVSGFGDARDGFYIPFDVDHGRARYALATTFTDDPLVSYDSVHWKCELTILGQSASAAIGSETNPWEADWSGTAGTLTHPALQQLADPSSAQGGVFVAGGTQDGVRYKDALNTGGRDSYTFLGSTENGYNQIHWGTFVEFDTPAWKIDAGDAGFVYYSLSDVATPDLAGTDKFVMSVSEVAYSQRGSFGGKPYYNKIGESNSTSLNAIFWSSATWHVTNAIGVDLDTSASAVATPDLATFLLGTVVTNVSWLNASDDTPAGITVTSVTQGELHAGFVFHPGGVDDPDVVYQVNGSENGCNKYSDVLGVAADTTWNGSKWTNGTNLNLGHVAFPWQGTPEVTITRDDVASEENWKAVP